MPASRLWSTAMLVAMCAGHPAQAQSAQQSMQQSAHVMQTPSEVKWGPAPPMLPPGAEIAVLEGDPSKAAPYTVRLKFPASYVVPAHSHPEDEHVTVVAGAFYIGMGDKLDKTSGKALGVGGFALLPANANHYAYTKGETVIVLYGRGPVDFKYVNPADDPRKSKHAGQ